MTKIFAHRGSMKVCPENTMAAFKQAVVDGVDGIEFDVHYTKDNELVVLHDPTVDRTTDGTGHVRKMTLQELKKLDAGSYFSEQFKGEKIPTLGEVLDWAEGTDILLNIELKHVALDYVDFEEKILEEISKRNLKSRVIISSFNHDALKKISTLMPEIETAILYMARLFEPWNYAKTLGARGLHPFIEGLDLSLVINAEQRGIPVRPFTVNNEKLIAGLIQAGCSGIITDKPERAVQIKNELLS